MCGQVLPRAAQVLRSVDRQPHALVAKCRQRPLGCKLREGAALVIPAGGKPADGLLAQHIYAAAHPPGRLGPFVEAGDEVSAPEFDDAERLLRPRDGNRGGGARFTVSGEQPCEVDGEQLIAVERVHIPRRAPG